MSLGILAAVAGPLAEAQTNMIVNGDMEIVSKDAIPGWQVSKPQDATSAIHSVESPVKKGKRALLLEGHGPWMSCSSEQIQVKAGTTYLAGAWIRTRKGQAYIQIDHWEDGKWVGSVKAPLRVVKDEWTQVSVESDSHRYPSATHLSAAITSDGPDVEVYVDEVMMTPLEAKK